MTTQYKAVAGIDVSDLTLGFFCLLEDVFDLWTSRQEGEEVPLPGCLLLPLLFVAAVAAALSFGADAFTQQAREWRRCRRLSYLDGKVPADARYTDPLDP